MPKKSPPESAKNARHPEELELHWKTLARAAASIEDPSEWPEEAGTLLQAVGPEEIGAILVKAFHRDLRHAKIGYLWVKKMGGRGRVTLGNARKASAHVKLYAELDFLLTFNLTAWQILTLEQRIALIDHELAHCGVEGDDKTSVLLDHDVEEFGNIITRWGLWLPSLREFGGVVFKALQFDLFHAENAVAGAGAAKKLKLVSDAPAELNDHDRKAQ